MLCCFLSLAHNVTVTVLHTGIWGSFRYYQVASFPWASEGSKVYEALESYFLVAIKKSKANPLPQSTHCLYKKPLFSTSVGRHQLQQTSLKLPAEMLHMPGAPSHVLRHVPTNLLPFVMRHGVATANWPGLKFSWWDPVSTLRRRSANHSNSPALLHAGSNATSKCNLSWGPQRLACKYIPVNESKLQNLSNDVVIFGPADWQCNALQWNNVWSELCCISVPSIATALSEAEFCSIHMEDMSRVQVALDVENQAPTLCFTFFGGPQWGPNCEIIHWVLDHSTVVLNFEVECGVPRYFCRFLVSNGLLVASNFRKFVHTSTIRTSVRTY